jgi:hypothetical protein
MDPITVTITVPADFAAQFMALVADLRKAVPAITASVQEAADALKEFKLTGPLGLKGGSS